MDEARGDLVCLGCGCAMGGLAYHAPDRQTWNDFEDQGAPLAQENLRDVAFDSIGVSQKRRANKGTYRRATYHRERLAQWFMEEPNIPETVWANIDESFRLLFPGDFRIPTANQRKRGKGKQISGTKSLTKGEIRRILCSCDALIEERRLEQLNQWPDHPLFKFHREEAGKKQVSYVTKYLERWITIRHHYSGESSTSKDCPDILFERTLGMLRQMEQALPFVREQMKRMSFPSVNMMIRNIFQLHRCLHLAKDFPELSTRRARKAADYCWWLFCRFHKWPYLLKEVKFLKRVNKVPFK